MLECQPIPSEVVGLLILKKYRGAYQLLRWRGAIRSLNFLSAVAVIFWVTSGSPYPHKMCTGAREADAQFGILAAPKGWDQTLPPVYTFLVAPFANRLGRLHFHRRARSLPRSAAQLRLLWCRATHALTHRSFDPRHPIRIHAAARRVASHRSAVGEVPLIVEKTAS